MHGSEGKKRISSVAVKIVKLSVKFKRCSYQQIILYIYISLCIHIYLFVYIYIYQDCIRKRRIVTRSLRLPFVLICMRKIKSRFSLFYLLFRPGEIRSIEKFTLVSSSKRGQFDATGSRSRLPVPFPQ